MFLTSNFMLGGFASVVATILTNPIEVIKTRLQLQGELAKRGTYVEPYKGILNAFITVAKNEGMPGLQKGLIPALYFQFIINSLRLSIYTHAIDNGWTQDKDGTVSFMRILLWGSIGGILGSVSSTPFFRVKTQLQAQAATAIAVGHQHEHTGMMSAFRNIYRKNGIHGLWHGASAALPRACIGSGAQMATFGWTKTKLREFDLVKQKTLNSLSAGLIAGSVMAIAITPPDVVTTRLYNQPLDATGKGSLYKGWLDCVIKISRTEGFNGLYKGFWANYMRFAPHSTLLLLFYDELIAMRERYSL